MLRYRYIPDCRRKTSRSHSEERPSRQSASTPTFRDARCPSSSPLPCVRPATFPSQPPQPGTPSSSSPRMSSSPSFTRSTLSPRLSSPPVLTTGTLMSSSSTSRREVSAVATSSPRSSGRSATFETESIKVPPQGMQYGALESEVRRSDSSPCLMEHGADFTMHGHYTSRRRKKRPMGHGMKSVQVSRGRSGYGFTISGQHPCVLSCIVGGSPADLAGLKTGDYLYYVNGINVSHAPHDDVVRMVGQSTGVLDLQVAENFNSSDSSEDDYPPRSKSRYPNRVRFRQPQPEVGCRAGIASRPLPQRPVEVQGSHTQHYRNHIPVGAESDLSTSVTSPGSSLSEESRHQEFADIACRWKRPVYEKTNWKSNSQMKLTDSNMSPEAQTFTMATVQNGPTISTAKISTAGSNKRPTSRSQDNLVHPVNDHLVNYGNLSVVSSVSSVEGAVAEAAAYADVADRQEDEVAMPAPGSEARALVGYIGSIELPGNINRPNQRLQQLRNAVRRLRVEQKIHTLVLMKVDISGVHLSNNMGNTIAHYTVDRLAFSGICPDDKRFFGIVTLNSVSDDVSEISGNTDGSPSSSCHVFMVDPDMCSHMLHSHKAKAFSLVCTPSTISTQPCLEFPQSPTHVILCIANLYRDRPRSKLDNDIIQSQAFADPCLSPQRSSSDNSSNTDSGLSFGREEPANDQVCVVDMHVDAAVRANAYSTGVNANAIIRHCSTPGVAVSHSLGSLQQDPLTGKTVVTTPSSLLRPMSAFEIRRGLNNSSSSEDCWIGQVRVDKLTPRAMPDPTAGRLSRALSSDGLEHNPCAENLRQSMQRLLQARQQQLQLEQAISSDSESQVSSSVQRSEPFSTRSAFQVPRPVSAPLQTRGRLQQVETVDLGFGKLSPRAFQQPGSMIRSPSAPPIPYFPHQDSDEEDDDTGSEDDPFVRSIISQFNRDRILDFGDVNPRRYSEGYALGKQRDKARAENEELHKWTKMGSFRRAHNTKLKSNVSQSHESLAVSERQNIASHKLVGASSVNSIVVASQNAPEETSGRVAGWAVSFSRLLSDPVGHSIFTEFLRKEFSEENIMFWSAVEEYKQITDENKRRAKAQEIYNVHLTSQGRYPINVDSAAQQFAKQCLDNPTADMFNVAQEQILQLMRTDSYSRFLKSDLYKGYLMGEMEGQTLVQPNSLLSKSNQEIKKKGKGKENEEKRRRSLLPWKQSKKSSSKEWQRKGKDKEVNNNLKKAPGPGIDLSTMRKEVFQPSQAEEIERVEPVKFCRVVMPDTSTTVVCTRPGHNIRSVLGKLCDKRSLSIASVDVFLLGSDKPLDLEEDISTLGSKEVIIERRVLFRLDLPNHKSIGVKAKPNRSIRDVFKPILNKYGHRIENCAVQLSGLSQFLDLDLPVSDLDNQRVSVITSPENAENHIGPAPQQVPLPPRHRRTLLHLPSRSRGAGGKSGSLEEITNQIFEDLMKGKSELAHAFDELGVVDLEHGGKCAKNIDEHRSLGLFGLLRKESSAAKDKTKPKSKGKVTFALPRSDSKKKKAAKAEELLMDEITRSHTKHLKEEVADFVATDCVETVEMAIQAESQRGLTLSPGESPLPPPDMFDDVHYMHSGPADRAHLSDQEQNEQLSSGKTTTVTPSRGRSALHMTTFGTPRMRTGTAHCKKAAVTVTEVTSSFPAMQPVIVDSRDSKGGKENSRLNHDLRMLGESVSPHFCNVHSFRPTKGPALHSFRPSPAPRGKLLLEKCPELDSARTAVKDISQDELKQENTTSSCSAPSSKAPPTVALPDAARTDAALLSEVVSTRQDHLMGIQSDLTYPSDSQTKVDRTYASRESPKSGEASDEFHVSPASSSPSLLSSSVSMAWYDAVPKYTPPPSYSTVMGHRQTSKSPIKRPLSNQHSADTSSSRIPSQHPVDSSFLTISPHSGDSAHSRETPSTRISSPYSEETPSTRISSPYSVETLSSRISPPHPGETPFTRISSPHSGETPSTRISPDSGKTPSTRISPDSWKTPFTRISPHSGKTPSIRISSPHSGETPFTRISSPDSGKTPVTRISPHSFCVSGETSLSDEADGVASPYATSKAVQDGMNLARFRLSETCYKGSKLHQESTESSSPGKEHCRSSGNRLIVKNHPSAHQALKTVNNFSAYDSNIETTSECAQLQQCLNSSCESWDIRAREQDSATSGKLLRDQAVISKRSHSNGFVVHAAYNAATAAGSSVDPAGNLPRLLGSWEQPHYWPHPESLLSPRQRHSVGHDLTSHNVVVAEVHHPQDHQPTHSFNSRTLPESPSFLEQTVTFV